MLFILGRNVNQICCVYALLEIYRGHIRKPGRRFLGFCADSSLFLLFKSGLNLYKLSINLYKFLRAF
jgi:hypothetical protein